MTRAPIGGSLPDIEILVVCHKLLLVDFISDVIILTV